MTARCIVLLAAALVGCGGDDKPVPEIGSVPPAADRAGGDQQSL
jgi:hypothetical protein